jgi:N-acetylneuraminic acid mutarotase
MKSYLILIFLLIHTFFLLSQNTWTRIADFPGTGRTGAIGFSINGKGYAGLGYDGSGQYDKKDLWEYDTLTNSWTQRADFPPGGRVGALVLTAMGKAYLIGGDSVGYHNDLWQYDPIADAWTKLDSLPAEPRAFSLGFSTGNKLYVIGGETDLFPGYSLQDVWEYNIDSHIWTQKANFQGGYRYLGSCFVANGRPFCGMGIIPNFPYRANDLYEYDTLQDTWTLKAAIPNGKEGAFSFTLENEGYIGCGISYNNSRTNDFWQYNPISDNWISAADYARGKAAYQVSFSIGNYGYAGLGYDSVYQRIKEFWQFSPVANLGIEDKYTDENKLIVYPNPCSSQLRIRNEELEIKEIRIYNVIGECVQQSPPLRGGREGLLDVSTLPNGVYFVELVSTLRHTQYIAPNDNRLYRKFVKQ